MTSIDRQVWTPDRGDPVANRLADAAGGIERNGWLTSLGRGLRGRCPVCGQRPMFVGYLTVVDHCSLCQTPLSIVPADDAPPWVTMFIALHALIGLVVLLGRTTSLQTGATLMIVLPVAVLLCLALLRPVKGSTVALLLKLDVRREDQEPR